MKMKPKNNFGKGSLPGDLQGVFGTRAGHESIVLKERATNSTLSAYLSKLNRGRKDCW